MSFQTIPLSWIDRQAAGVTATGLSVERIYERALITPKYGDERDKVCPLQLTLAYASIVLDTDDGAHGMTSKRLPPHLGPLGIRLLFGGGSLQDGLEAMSKFYQACAPSLRFELTTSGDQAFLAVQFQDDREDAILQEDVQLCYHFFGLTSFLGRAFPVSWVGTRDPEHMNLGSAHWAIKCRVKLHACAGLAFPRALLAARPHRPEDADPVWGPFDSWLAYMEQAPVEAPLGINNRDLHVGRYAASLGVAPSTYRSMMSQSGEGFRQFREQALLSAALEMLKGSDSTEAIAAELGYSDARSFRRFIKRATGSTPSELRNGFGVSVPVHRIRARLREVLGLMPL